MNRSFICSLGLGLALAMASALATLAQDNGNASPPAPAKGDASPTKTTRASGYPFRGKLKGVNKDAMTFTLAGKEKDRVFHVTADTKFVKEGKTVTLAAGVDGEDVAGYARTTPEGKVEAATVRFGAAPADATKKTAARKAPKPAATGGTEKE